MCGNLGTARASTAATDWYVEDGYYINSILRNDGDLEEYEERYVKALDEATNGKVEHDTLYRVVDANTVFEDMDDFDYVDLRAHILLGDSAYDKGAYSQAKKARMQGLVDDVIGKTTTDKGFMSTTSSEEIAQEKTHGEAHGRNKVILELTNVKGTKGKDISDYDRKHPDNDPESETLLARNHSYTYKRMYAKDGCIYIEAEIKKKK